MGRHRTPEEKRELGERGVPLPDGLVRPRAKDDLRALAVVMRQQGATYDEIALELGVSKSTCSLWLRDLPRPEDDPVRAAAAQARRVAALRARARRDRDQRDERGRQVAQDVSESLGVITSRDLVLAMAVSYWCEGAKAKPWNRRKSVQWMNSDPMLVSLFLEGLDLVGIERDRLGFRLHIHQTADEEASRRWWATHTGVPLAQFSRSTIKRHAPATVRQNTGEDYRGCLCVTVRRSRELYEVLDGLVQGLATQPRAVEEWHDL